MNWSWLKWKHFIMLRESMRERKPSGSAQPFNTDIAYCPPDNCFCHKGLGFVSSSCLPTTITWITMALREPKLIIIADGEIGKVSLSAPNCMAHHPRVCRRVFWNESNPKTPSMSVNLLCHCASLLMLFSLSLPQQSTYRNRALHGATDI